LFDVADLAALAAPANRRALPTFRAAVMAAREYIAVEQNCNAVNSLCVCADGTLQLVRVGPCGGVRRLWNFGAV
jgi:hypothetical protein